MRGKERPRHIVNIFSTTALNRASGVYGATADAALCVLQQSSGISIDEIVLRQQKNLVF